MLESKRQEWKKMVQTMGTICYHWESKISFHNGAKPSCTGSMESVIKTWLKELSSDSLVTLDGLWTAEEGLRLKLQVQHF